MPPLIRGGGEKLIPFKSQFSTLAHSTTEEKGDFSTQRYHIGFSFSGGGGG